MQVETEVRDDRTGQVKREKSTLQYKIRVYKRHTENSQCPICRKLAVVPLSPSPICSECLSMGLTYDEQTPQIVESEQKLTQAEQ